MALDIHPNLILLDIIMPAVGGAGVITNSCQDKWGKQLEL